MAQLTFVKSSAPSDLPPRRDPNTWRLSDRLARFLWPTVLLILIASLLWIGYLLPWTGFGPRLDPNGLVQPARTLWDWLQLLVMPAVFTFIGLSFISLWGRTTFAISQQQLELASHTAKDDQQERALQSYLEHINSLLLDKNLRGSQPADEVRATARAWTLATLRLLDSKRNHALIQFLKESGLFSPSAIISFKGADLSGVDLTGAELRGLDFSGANMQRTCFHAANLLQSNLSTAILNEVDLSQANLNYADLKRSDLRGGNFNEAQLFRASLSTTRLEDARLTRANLTMADLKVSRLNNAKLNEANLTDADLSNAILFNAAMRGANLTDANLTNTSLTNADLSGAILTGAKVTEKQLLRAASLAGATMPDGTIRPPAT